MAIKQRGNMQEPIAIAAEKKARVWSALGAAARGTLSREEALLQYKVTEEELLAFEPRWKELQKKPSR